MQEHDDDSFDRRQFESEAASGARALAHLFHHAGKGWAYWSVAIRGWRALREIAFHESGGRNLKAQGYRDSMGALLRLKRNAIYDEIDEPTRSFMYKLCDHIDAVDDWYATLNPGDKLRWVHPQSVVKHCPPEYLGKEGGERRRAKKGKKKKGNPEADRLRKILVYLVEKYVRPVDPGEAAKLLQEIWGDDDPDDSIDDFYPDTATQ